MVEVEKKRAAAIDEKMAVNIDLESGITSLVLEEKDQMFSQEQQSHDVNQFMATGPNATMSEGGGLYKPFEEGGPDLRDPQALMESINNNSFQIRATDLKDEKTKAVYE